MMNIICIYIHSYTHTCIYIFICFTAKQKTDSHPKFLEERTTKVTLLTTQDSRLFQVPSAGIVAGWRSAPLKDQNELFQLSQLSKISPHTSFWVEGNFSFSNLRPWNRESIWKVSLYLSLSSWLYSSFKFVMLVCNE